MGGHPGRGVQLAGVVRSTRSPQPAGLDDRGFPRPGDRAGIAADPQYAAELRWPGHQPAGADPVDLGCPGRVDPNLLGHRLRQHAGDAVVVAPAAVTLAEVALTQAVFWRVTADGIAVAIRVQRKSRRPGLQGLAQAADGARLRIGVTA